MGKPSAKQDVTEYRMSIHFGVALQVDSIHEIHVDEKLAWEGSAAVNTTLDINKPDLFGGQRKEGGLIGKVQVLLGAADQTLTTATAARYGLTPSTCPGFRGLTTLMFYGSDLVSTGNAQGFTRAPNEAPALGFLWKMNTPVIGQAVWVKARRAPKGLNPATAMIGIDANPAHMIYECLLNTEWGMSGSVELIGTASFEAAATTLFNEAFGLSILWSRQTEIESFISEILDHIQATLYVNPNTGLLDIKLLRDDYDLVGLRVITPDNAALSNFKRRSSGEIVNEISVTWTNPANEQEESITAQDIASIASQGGQKVAATRNYYGVRNLTLATKLLARDLRASTAPLISTDAKLDRTAWNVLPGEVMLLNWPERGASNVVVRAGKVGYGKPRDSKIKVALVQDIFSLSRPPMTVLPGTDHVNPSVPPSALTVQVFTLPSYFTRNAAIQTDPVTLTPPEVLAGILADSVSTDSLDFELMSESVGPDGSTIITSKGAMSLAPRATLATAIVAQATTLLPAALFPDIDEAPRVGGFVFFGTGDADQEIALVSAASVSGWTVQRGVLDTTPKAWPIGTPVWCVNPGARIVDNQTIHAGGTTAVYRALDRTTQGLLDYASAPVVSTLLTERPHLPLRPANVTVGGVGFGTYALGGATSFTVAWATRNRLLEDTQVLLWTDGSVAPEHRQETVISIYNVATGLLIVEHNSLWTETSKVFQKADFDRYASIRIDVSSRMDGQNSLDAHSITVTGFANNGSSTVPPAPGRQPPPSTVVAPNVASFAPLGTSKVAPSGASVPTIRITGQQDNPDATELVTSIRLVGQTAWSTGATTPLNRESMSFDITEPVAPGAEYGVRVAYRVDGLLGNWRVLSNVVTGGLATEWVGGVLGRPANLISLIGSEAINNALIRVAASNLRTKAHYAAAALSGGAAFVSSGMANGVSGYGFRLVRAGGVTPIVTCPAVAWPKNTDVIISFLASTEGGTATLHSDLFPDTLPETSHTITTTPARFSFLINSGLSGMDSASQRLFIPSGPDVVANATDIMVETGNVATAWRPSDVDVEGLRLQGYTGPMNPTVGATIGTDVRTSDGLVPSTAQVITSLGHAVGVSGPATHKQSTGRTAPMSGAIEFIEVEDGVPVVFSPAHAVPPTVFGLMENLEQLQSGEYYDVRAQSLTATGFTPRVKRVQPGSTPVYTPRLDDGAGGLFGTLPSNTISRQKALSGYAYNGNYTFNLEIKTEGNPNIDYASGVEPINVTVTIYARKVVGGPLIEIGSDFRVASSTVGGGATTGMTIVGYLADLVWDVHADAEYTAVMTSGYYAGRREITQFTSVTWSEQTSGAVATTNSALAGGRKAKFAVVQKNG